MKDTFQKYGLTFKVGTSNYSIEKYCFRNNHLPENGGLGRYGHLRNAMQLAYGGKFVYNAYADKLIKKFCENDSLNIWGCGGIGKSTVAAAIAVVYWHCAPKETLVTLYTTTLSKHNLRAFGEIVKWFHVLKSRFPDTPGRHIESTHKIVYDSKKEDDEKIVNAGIFAFATQKRDERFKVNDQSGVHGTYNLRIVDEMNGCDPTVLDGFANFLQGGEENKIVCMANPDDWNNIHGQISIPVNGVDSITPEDEEWESTKGFHVLYLSSLKCPSITEEDGERKYKFFPKKAGIERIRKMFGEDSIQWYQQVLGFMPPSGIRIDTVLTQPMVNEFMVRTTPVFTNVIARIAGFDPSSTEGGDKKILTLATLGVNTKNIPVLRIDEQMILKVKVSSQQDFSIALAKEVIRICQEWKIPKNNVAVDNSGSDGIADTIDVLWDDENGRIHRVYFNGHPTDKPVSNDDLRSGREAYDRRVTELWMNVRNFVMSEQLKCIPEAAIEQFCARKVETKYNKWSVARKPNIPGFKSPDEADSVVVLIDLLRERFNINATICSQGSETEIQRYANRYQGGQDLYEDPFANYCDDELCSEEYYM